MNVYAHQEECSIDRTTEPTSALLRNCEGDVLQRFHPIWSDEQIFLALSFANRTYERGVAVGKWQKANEIKKALEGN